MADRQILLQGGNWKIHLLIYVLVLVIGLVILHLWRPGIITAFFDYAYDSFAFLFRSIGNFFVDLKEKL